MTQVRSSDPRAAPDPPPTGRALPGVAAGWKHLKALAAIFLALSLLSPTEGAAQDGIGELLDFCLSEEASLEDTKSYAIEEGFREVPSAEWEIVANDLVIARNAAPWISTETSDITLDQKIASETRNEYLRLTKSLGNDFPSSAIVSKSDNGEVILVISDKSARQLFSCSFLFRDQTAFSSFITELGIEFQGISHHGFQNWIDSFRLNAGKDTTRFATVLIAEANHQSLVRHGIETNLAGAVLITILIEG